MLTIKTDFRNLKRATKKLLTDNNLCESYNKNDHHAYVFTFETMRSYFVTITKQDDVKQAIDQIINEQREAIEKSVYFLKNEEIAIALVSKLHV